MPIQTTSTGFDLVLDGKLLLRHRHMSHGFLLGQGDARMDMYRGNFETEDYVIERTPLRSTRSCPAPTSLFRPVQGSRSG